MTAGGYGPRPYLCTCGKVVHGNLARASHRRACTEGRYYSDMEAYRMRAYAYDTTRPKNAAHPTNP